MPGLLDHLLVLGFALLLPIYGHLTWPTFQRDAAAGKPGVRTRAYLELIALQALLTIAALWRWADAERPWSSLGLAVDGGVGFWIVAVAGASISLFLVAQIVRVLKRSPAELDHVREQLAAVEALIPRTRSERNVSVALALSAGVSEEILWRGFLLFYAQSYLPTWAAAAIAIGGFGAGHMYQGTAGATKCAALGAVMLALYLVSGSLVVPILLHAVVDLQGMLIGFHALGAWSASGAAPPPAPAT